MQISFSAKPVLVKWLDAQVKGTGHSRSSFVRRIVEEMARMVPAPRKSSTRNRK